MPKCSLPAEGLTFCKALILLYGGVNRFIFVLLCAKMGLTYPSRFLCRKALAHRDGSFLLFGCGRVQANITIRKKDGGYQVVVSYKDGKRWRQKSKQGFETRRAAKEYGQDIIEELKNTISVFIPEDLKTITLRDFLSLYLEERVNLTYNTRTSYRLAIQFFSEIAPLPIREITHAQIIRIFNDHKLSAGTRNMYLVRLRTIFNYARRPYGIITHNPCDSIERVKTTTRKVKTFSQDEIDALFSYLKSTSLYRYTLICVARYTGCRYGEILGITWDDVNFTDNTISINKQFVRISKAECRIGPLKTKSSYRVLPMPPSLVRVLKYYRIHSKNNRLFPENISESAAINRFIRRVVKDKTIHDFRHTYATTLLANGADIKTVASLLGDNVSTVINTYVHYTDEMRLKAAEKVSDVFK